MSDLVTCPLCGQYDGKPESVRAHISAKRDDAHTGHSGFEFNGELGMEEDEKDSETASSAIDETSSASQESEYPALDLDGAIKVKDHPAQDDFTPDIEPKSGTAVPTVDEEPEESAQSGQDIPSVQSVERSKDEEGNELVKLTLYGAGAYALAKFFAGQNQNSRHQGPRGRDRI